MPRKPNLDKDVMKALHELMRDGSDHFKLEAARLWLAHGRALLAPEAVKESERPLRVVFEDRSPESPA